MVVKDKSKAIILWFEELRKEDVPLVGGKNANLGEMISAGIPVPPGFAVTAYAYKRFIEETGISDKIMKILKETIKEGHPTEYEKASERIRKLIMETPMPKDIEESIREAYRELCRRIGIENVRVAVRSSATAEDLPDASFAGQQETYLNVIGEDEVVNKVKMCWASLWTARAIYYRESKGFDHSKVLISVAVQKMVNSRSAGVMFTIHPVTGEENKIVIESSWGLGESVVQGKVTPDEVIVDKATLKILEMRVNDKYEALLFDPVARKNVVVKLPKSEEELKKIEEENPGVAQIIRKFNMFQNKPSITEEEARKLAELAIKIENHYGRAMDIEWAIDQDLPYPQSVFIVQARPETVWSAKKVKEEAKKEEAKAPAVAEKKILVRGLPASPGVAIGVAKVALTVEEAAKLMKKGDILVTKMTDPDWVPYMKIAAAIITDEGGMTAHAAIVSRELGIPCIVGTKNATKVIKTGMEITVDATHGVVYEGRVEELVKKEEAAVAEEVKPSVGVAIPKEILREVYPVTATKIYMNLGEPEMIDKYIDLPFDGIGLMRIEFIISDWIGYHPMYLVETGKPELFVDKLAEGIARVAQAVYPRPVVVRFSDFKTNEYRGLKGGEKYEPEERNPMIGWRGVSRYISPGYEPGFRLELKAIRKVREEYGLKNVWVMLPFVRTTWEVERILKIMEEEGLRRSRDFKVWIMAEVPSVIFLADEFSKLVDGFSIGSNDLTQLILGADRDSAILGRLGYFDERDPAVKRAIAHLIRVAHAHGATVSICGQAPSVYPEFTEFLVRLGIDSISVNPDVVISTRRLVASIERKIMLERLAGEKVEETWKPQW
ncbi:MAG TPA: phosphoenolpyruvate synthase [Desulfurococcales archaeon]|nr:phosphoenolpyruvate synthase [Desulfurococcales archaeon]